MSVSHAPKLCFVCGLPFNSSKSHEAKLNKIQVPLQRFCQQVLNFNCSTSDIFPICGECIYHISGAIEHKRKASELEKHIRKMKAEMQFQEQEFAQHMDGIGSIIRKSVQLRTTSGMADNGSPCLQAPHVLRFTANFLSGTSTQGSIHGQVGTDMAGSSTVGLARSCPRSLTGEANRVNPIRPMVTEQVEDDGVGGSRYREGDMDEQQSVRLGQNYSYHEVEEGSVRMSNQNSNNPDADEMYELYLCNTTANCNINDDQGNDNGGENVP